MKLRAPSCPVLAAIAYAIFAVFGLAIWYPLLFIAVPTGTSTLQTLQELLTFDSLGHFLYLHTVATLVALAFAVALAFRPIVTRRSSFVAVLSSTLFAVTAWALYQSDTALLPTVAAASLTWNYFKSQVRPSEA